MSSAIVRPPLSPAASRYDSDLHAWAKEQAQLIRAGRFDAVDIENVAEEIESLGRSTKSELRSRLATLIEHLLKLDASPSPGPRRQWRGTVNRSRVAIAELLDDNPSLRPQIRRMLADIHLKTVFFAANELGDAGEYDAANHVRAQEGAPFTEEELFGEWFPEPGNARAA